jgi:hypothetical protein
MPRRAASAAWGFAATEEVAILKPGSRTVSAFEGERIVALCEMRAGRLNPVRVFQL